MPHLSIGDGWWAEGFNGSNGWLIEGQPIRTIMVRQDGRTRRRSIAARRTARAAFYDRDERGFRTDG